MRSSPSGPARAGACGADTQTMPITPREEPQTEAALRTLVGGLTHELSNALYVIQGYSEMLEDDLRGESAHQALLEEIRTANAKAQALATAFDAIADPGPEGDCTAPYALLKEFAKRLIGRLPECISLRHGCTGSLPTLCLRAASFHALLDALTQSGLDFLAAEGGVIELRLIEMPDPPGRVGLVLRAASHALQDGPTDPPAWRPSILPAAQAAQAAGAALEEASRGGVFWLRAAFD